MPNTSLAYIGLGSNVDNPAQQVTQALSELDQLPLSRLVDASSLYRSKPVGPQDQPDFVNAVAALETRLSPLALLDQLQALEQHHRRRREHRWGPRTLDLDVLLFNHTHIAHTRLCVPHREMHARAFVLRPLIEIAPHLTLNGQPLEYWLAPLADEITPLDSKR
ncbi:2-amino-4-hydroxy-6-hydroxymethyldihydropteridine diphosphokinase [Halomonas llamarensis]|uniref:2-amino-4-hydroxy-6-hydroxymethyldihydropteridine pyrophosphokinase n=1 Tax=Halomonas llamarensis TaxID=2945104 RepID=A0ABT0STJ6_9GAMM|nr:2-amino-4-hydroxy-6-hydroxymethyldihydropteridine diphosphokinase [Halomonas llamarensis]MCL7930951.1 2-amino-4-hydroxy-6-hydroxymethyldihydropteridine diphosphokinase [Halomonas llamarensis]